MCVVEASRPNCYVMLCGIGALWASTASSTVQHYHQFASDYYASGRGWAGLKRSGLAQMRPSLSNEDVNRRGTSGYEEKTV